jgi:hypothetical protein
MSELSHSPRKTQQPRTRAGGERIGGRTRPLHEAEPRAIYYAGDRVGHLVLRDGEFLAFDKHHRPMCSFDTTTAATAAILKAREAGQ